MYGMYEKIAKAIKEGTSAGHLVTSTVLWDIFDRLAREEKKELEELIQPQIKDVLGEELNVAERERLDKEIADQLNEIIDKKEDINSTPHIKIIVICSAGRGICQTIEEAKTVMTQLSFKANINYADLMKNKKVFDKWMKTKPQPGYCLFTDGFGFFIAYHVD